MSLHKTSNYSPSIVLRFNVHFSLKIFARFFWFRKLDQAKSCLNFSTVECDLLREKFKQEKYWYFLVGNRLANTSLHKDSHTYTNTMLHYADEHFGRLPPLVVKPLSIQVWFFFHVAINWPPTWPGQNVTTTLSRRWNGPPQHVVFMLCERGYRY